MLAYQVLKTKQIIMRNFTIHFYERKSIEHETNYTSYKFSCKLFLSLVLYTICIT